MKKIIAFILAVVALVGVMSFAGCNNTDTDKTTAPALTTKPGASATTTVQGGTVDIGTTTQPVKQEVPSTAGVFEFSKYGYHIYYPQGFEIINNEGNMIEFMNDTGVDYTILVLENNYDSLTKLLNGELEENEQIVKQGANYALTYLAEGGRINYTYYYHGKELVRCELSYPEAQKDAMKGAEESIMVEEHAHAH